ncbi:Four helix bundle protein [Flavobacterium longum]|uniref:four helix bundle protein n=1 Tax=Flavobacterium longum TaxID=1299340 RepID=UPI0039ED52F2
MDYTKLNVWIQSRTLVNAVYDLSEQFPKKEMFGLSDQMRRAAVSVPSNIAEGCGRKSIKETLRFLYFSRGSLFEIETQCYLALDRKYIKEQEFKSVFESIQNCKRLLNGFINHYTKY